MISVIVPVYNVESYIKKCVNSIANQSHKNLEILLIDDGSTDSSLSILKELAKQDNRIKIFSKLNGGLSDARNYGIQRATGKYLSFVDSDDWIEPYMLQKMYNLAEQNSCDIVICNLQKVNQEDKIFKLLPQMETNQPETSILQEDFSSFGNLSWFACNKLFLKSVFNNIKFTENIHFEDIATIPRLMFNAKKIGYLNEYLYNYFEREGSITRSFTEKGLDMFTAISIVKNSFKTSQFSNNHKAWKDFVIINGFYSFLAYVARVKNSKLKQTMFKELSIFLKKENISYKEIIKYKRFSKNYVLSLSFTKIIYYLLQIVRVYIIKY